LNGTIPRPRRTIRAVGWVNEELGSRGAEQYKQDHQAELSNHVLAMESDRGNFQPEGFGFSGPDAALAIIQNISQFLEPIGANIIVPGDGSDTDNGVLVGAGVNGMALNSIGGNDDGDFYFNYHHSNADMMTALDYDGLRLCVGATAVYAYIVADMEQTLPKK